MSPEERIQRAKDGFAQALDGHPWVTVESLFEEVAAGHAFIWHGAAADVFVRCDWPVVELGPVAGDVEEMTGEMLPEIEAWAAANGFGEIHVQAGRQGWSRVLRQRGFDEAAVIMRKRIGGTLN